jgi:chromatin segregation and condensation protein Rec8/ScpA/Scc1 (kleisin family)
LDTEEELIRKKNRSLYALQELISHAKNNRPSRSDEISKIEKGLEDVEDMKNYVRKFDDLEQLVDGFISEVNSEPPNPQNEDWLNRLISIREAISGYRNAYADYAAHFDKSH